jgi:hypothetical protein
MFHLMNEAVNKKLKVFLFCGAVSLGDPSRSANGPSSQRRSKPAAAGAGLSGLGARS